ncbi:hypothetical protein J2Z40_003924 [Cytobacillus eiseniae]|uniref:ABC transporter permease n=1 Tax=Cytobacillus eiseniae TaxID=762947 RepID=A0ABS4RKI7_9BACI|nr:hypothetical protein [Cytobacillus eiseniae]MBP2243308.1 hypothetical protein [Cytobacillus eiseniae]
MMSLTTVNLLNNIKKLYLFKLKANIDSFSSLIGIQLLALLFSLGGVTTIGSFSSNLHIDIKYYSADLVIVFTMIWSFVTAITITTKPYRNHDFSFVTNRLTSSVANILFLFTASMLGGITAMLSGNLLKIAITLLLDEPLYLIHGGVGEIAIGAVAAILYIFGISAIGYFIGALVQVSKLFILLLPILLIGSLYFDGMLQRDPIITDFFKFFLFEASFLIFIVKALLTSVLFFLASIVILNRMEVRR